MSLDISVCDDLLDQTARLLIFTGYVGYVLFPHIEGNVGGETISFQFFLKKGIPDLLPKYIPHILVDGEAIIPAAVDREHVFHAVAGVGLRDGLDLSVHLFEPGRLVVNGNVGVWRDSPLRASRVGAV